MKTKITKQTVLKDFGKLKDYAAKCIKNEDYRQALVAIEMCSKVMYNFNLKYADDDLEDMLCKISSLILTDKKYIKKDEKERKIVFYDYFAIDNRCLTQQYLSALIELDYEILYITYERENKKRSERIFFQLEQYKKANVYTIKSKDYIESAKELFNIINKFGASTALIHTTPWDIVGILAFSNFNNIERFLINITDHAFWLGKCCSDYILEFRSYGYNISRKYRNISEDKLILLPYYPIQDLHIPFEGFPFNDAGKKVIFSGGSLYKIYGSKIFFDTVKHIVDKHEDAIFLYAGGGNPKPFEDFITNNNLKEKVFLINERKDIAQIFRNCYFYLATYPLGGGLMSQYAIASGKVPVGYADPSMQAIFIESFLINVGDKRFTHTNLKDYYEAIDRLIENDVYKKNLEQSLENLIITKKEFATNLLSGLNNKSTKFLVEKNDINDTDVEEFSKLYFEIENNYVHDYYFIFIKTKNVRLAFKFINYFILGVWKSRERIIKKVKNLLNVSN